MQDGLTIKRTVLLFIFERSENMGYSKSMSEESRKRVEDFFRENGMLYTINEAAAILGKSQYTVKKYIKDGKLEGTMVGSRWCVAKAAIEAFLRPGAK